MIPGVEILAPLSSGGMGEVLLGRKIGPHGFEKLVAVKKIRSDFLDREDVRAMFLDEARLLSRLSHPAIAQIFDFGEDDGTLFIVMEYVAGVSFDRLIELAGDSLAPALSARLVAEVCRGLHAAHELADLEGRSLGIVHRDITPENLVLGFDGGVKILDFGIALMRDRIAPVTQVGAIRGKRAYLAPEQLRGEAIDRRADIYGASAVLFELIAGARCFGERSFAVGPPARLGVECPPAIEAVVLRGLAGEPGARFGDAREMAEVLERIAGELGGERIEAFAERVLGPLKSEHAAKMRAWSTPRAPRVTEIDEPPPPKKHRWPLYLGPAALLIATALLFATLQSEPSTPAPTVRLEQPSPPPPVAPETKEQPKPQEPPLKPKPPLKTKTPTPKITATETAFAQLTIGAKPYALIYIDEKQVGPTPIVDLQITAGEHRIRAIEPDTDRVRFDERVRIIAGEHKRLTIR